MRHNYGLTIYLIIMLLLAVGAYVIQETTMPDTINVDWSSLSPEDKKILNSIGFKEPKKKRKRKPKQFTNLKDKGVPVEIQRNIFCCCCKSITVEFVTSYVPKELQNKNREAITDTVRTCKKCRVVLANMRDTELIDMILEAYRTFTYN